MAQLTDDCFAFSGQLLLLADMERLIAERISPITEHEAVSLPSSIGRVLADDAIAPLDLPPFDNSAVDGFAVRYRDLAERGETRLAIVGRAVAGHASPVPLMTGQAVRIFTGAPMPSGADTVFMQEDCRVSEDEVVVPAGLSQGANRRLSGEDLRRGAVALRAGRRLTAPDVALAAAMGMTQFQVHRRPCVALFSTGDEIIEPGGQRSDPALFDANRYLLTAMLAKLGARVTDLGILADDREVLKNAVAAAAEDHDLVLTSGGISTGEADHVRAAVEDVGHLVFWRIAVKPGRPLAMGVIKGAAFMGLPGNPVAAFVTFARVVRPLLLRLSGAIPEPLIALPVRLTFGYRKKAGRREYVRVTVRQGSDGIVEAVKHPQDGAGVITSLTQTDGLAELPEDMTAVEPGMMAGFLPYAVLME